MRFSGVDAAREANPIGVIGPRADADPDRGRKHTGDARHQGAREPGRGERKPGGQPEVGAQATGVEGAPDAGLCDRGAGGQARR